MHVFEPQAGDFSATHRAAVEAPQQCGVADGAAVALRREFVDMREQPLHVGAARTASVLHPLALRCDTFDAERDQAGAAAAAQQRRDRRDLSRDGALCKIL